MSKRQSETFADKDVLSFQPAVGKPAARAPLASRHNALLASHAHDAVAHSAALRQVAHGSPLRAHDFLLHLQQTRGNRYVQRVLAVARQAADEAQSLVTPGLEAEIERSCGGGQPLDAGVRRSMESAFASDFGGVRIHTDPGSHTLNRAVNAVAFTTGRDIFFSNGAYRPESSAGRELLAHELTHVVQQGAASPVSTSVQRLQIQRLCPGCEEEEKKVQGKFAISDPHDRYEQEADQVAKLVAGTIGLQDPTRSPAGGGGGDEDVTANGDGGVKSEDGGVKSEDGGVKSGGSGKPPADNCSVKSGPTYSPTGNIPVTKSGGRKSASFSFSAEFDKDATTGKKPSCCEVHQFIKWDKAYETSKGGPPHGGFPSGTKADTWIEDRDANDKRYGHRTDSHSDPIAGCGDEYKTGSTRDQANGNTYCGNDNPGAPESRKGQFQFQLKVVDTCNGDAVKATSSVISVNW